MAQDQENKLPSSTSKSGKSTLYGLLGLLLPLALVLGVGWYFWDTSRKASEEKKSRAGELADAKARLTVGRDYHVYARVLDFFEQRHDGDDWDSIGDGPPDPFYRIYRGGAEIFKSAVHKDTFTAVTSPLGVDLYDAVRGGKITLASVLQAATVAYHDEQAGFRIEVVDQDGISRNDVALDREFRLSHLQPGDNVFEFAQSEDVGLRRLVLRVIDAEAPVPDQLNLLGESP